MYDERSFGQSTEMYLKTICELADIHGLVPISALAERLGISAVSATEMIHRMEEKGLVTHTPYKGVCLTKAGLRPALDVIRRHRLWERFLADVLKLPWEEVHDMACNLEHTVGPEVTDALGAYLGRSSTCPHGNPIPSSPDELSIPDDIQLDELQVGESGVVRRIRLETTPMLRHLAAHGIKPGTHIFVEGVDPFDGPRAIKVGERKVVLGRKVAARVMIETSSLVNREAQEV